MKDRLQAEFQSLAGRARDGESAVCRSQKPRNDWKHEDNQPGLIQPGRRGLDSSIMAK